MISTASSILVVISSPIIPTGFDQRGIRYVLLHGIPGIFVVGGCKYFVSTAGSDRGKDLPDGGGKGCRGKGTKYEYLQKMFNTNSNHLSLLIETWVKGAHQHKKKRSIHYPTIIMYIYMMDDG